MKRVEYLRIAAVVVAAILVAVVVISTHTSSASAGASQRPRSGPSPVQAGKGPKPANSQFIYTVQAYVPGAVKRAETWASVDGSRTGSVRWTRCSMGGHITPPCLIRLPAGRGPDKLNDRTYAGIQQKLPVDPALLASYLERHNSCDANPGNPMLPPNQAAFSEIVMIADAIQVLPPGYGALLFRAAAKIPGTSVLAHVADAAGGSGTAVSMIESTPKIASAGRNWGRLELIFTPRTYQYIGLQQYRGPSARGPWTLTSATSLRSYKFVKTAPHDYTHNASMGSAPVCVSP